MCIDRLGRKNGEHSGSFLLEVRRSLALLNRNKDKTETLSSVFFFFCSETEKIAPSQHMPHSNLYLRKWGGLILKLCVLSECMPLLKRKNIMKWAFCVCPVKIRSKKRSFRVYAFCSYQISKTSSKKKTMISDEILFGLLSVSMFE